MSLLQEAEERLQNHQNFTASINEDGILVVQSNSWDTLPNGNTPEVVYITENRHGSLDIRPVGGGEAFERSIDSSISYLESLCE